MCSILREEGGQLKKEIESVILDFFWNIKPRVLVLFDVGSHKLLLSRTGQLLPIGPKSLNPTGWPEGTAEPSVIYLLVNEELDSYIWEKFSTFWNKNVFCLDTR